MGIWTGIPRGVRVRLERVLPEWWWAWLHQLREVEVDRRWLGGRLLLAAHPELSAPRNAQEALNTAECRVFSQNGEDGIIAWILSIIGAETRTFVEFGIGDGSECNTANLALTFGWRGLLMEADPELCARARRFYAGRATSRSRTPTIVAAEVGPDTIDDLLAANAMSGEIDVLSVDIDGNDYWVWKSLTATVPRLVVIEYNATFGPERSVTVPYKHGFDRYREHMSGFYHGASLAALTKLARSKGYALVGCDSRGSNAFYVRTNLVEPPLSEPEPEQAFFPLYERAHLSLDQQLATIRGLPLVEV